MKVQRLFRWLGFASLLGTAACGASDLVRGDDSIADASELVAEEDLRIGSVEDPDVGFSRIGGIEVDAEGIVYVLEARDYQIRVYDEKGRRLRTIGREGEGPGEFRNPALIGFRHDTLAVSDVGLGRVTFFNRTGVVLQTLSMPPLWLQLGSNVGVMPVPVRFRGDGFATAIARMVTPPEPPVDSIWIPHVVLDRRGQVADTFRLEAMSLSKHRIPLGGRNVNVPAGPSSAPLYLDGQDDTYVVKRPVPAAPDQAAFTVTRISKSGDTVYHRVIRYRPTSFSDELVDSIIAQTLRPHLRREGVDSGPAAAGLRRAMTLPPYQPPIVEGRVGADEVLWLRLHDESPDRDRWIMLEPDGRVRGVLAVPRGARIHWSSGETAWAAVSDEFDVPWLVRYRLRSGGR